MSTDLEKFENKWAGLDPWQDDFGNGMERRGRDGYSWYDISINANSIPYNKELAIIVTAWTGQLKWLRATLECYRKSGAFVILAYDNPLYPWSYKNANMQRLFPNPYHYILANAVVHKHITGDSDKRNGWFWDVFFAKGIISQFPNIKYVYHTNGDCICEKPEGFKDVIDLMGDADMMAGQSTDNVIHTADVLYKAEAFHKVFDYMFKLMKTPILGSRSPELMMKEAVDKLGIRYKHVPQQPRDKDGTVDMYACYGQSSTWRDLLGFRNLFAEYEVAGNECRIPTIGAYADLYMDCLYWSGEERETICQFWKTGDRRYLYMWLARWADSDYNRLFIPLDYFSKEPIYDEKLDEIYFRQI